MSELVVTTTTVCPERCCCRTRDSELLYPGAVGPPDETQDLQVSRPMYEIFHDTPPRRDEPSSNVLTEYGQVVDDFDFTRPPPGDWWLIGASWERHKAGQRERGLIPIESAHPGP